MEPKKPLRQGGAGLPGQSAGEGRVARAMKPVALQTLRGGNVRQRKAAGNIGVGGMKRSVEAGRLRQVRREAGHGINGSKVVYVVVRGQRDAGGDLRAGPGRDQRGRGQIGAAMHDAVPHPRQRCKCHATRHESAQNGVERCGVIGQSAGLRRGPNAHPPCPAYARGLSSLQHLKTSVKYSRLD